MASERLVLYDLKQSFADPADVVGSNDPSPLTASKRDRLTSLRRPFARAQKGDRVTIEARRRGLSIQTVGVTKSHGELGQTITVSNVPVRRDLPATVVGQGWSVSGFNFHVHHSSEKSDSCSAALCSSSPGCFGSSPRNPRRQSWRKYRL